MWAAATTENKTRYDVLRARPPATSQRAYEQRQVGPADIDVAEVHDSFSIAEIIHYEDLGFCEPGEGGKLVENGETAIGGRLPVNTGGGLLNRGHPLGATGVAQIVELATNSAAVRASVRWPGPEPRWRTSPAASTRATSPRRVSPSCKRGEPHEIRRRE